MLKWDSTESADKIAEMPFEKRFEAKGVYSMLSRTAIKYSGRPAVSFQIDAGQKVDRKLSTGGNYSGRLHRQLTVLNHLELEKKIKSPIFCPIVVKRLSHFWLDPLQE